MVNTAIPAVSPAVALGSYPGIRDRIRAAESTFTASLTDAASVQEQAVKEQAYIQHLRNKYGAHFRIESIPKDSQTLERLGKSMHGDDVIIAPNIVAEMARDPDVAAWYENTIDHCFATVPQDKAYFAAMGLTFEPCGVVVHEDGTVTYICGGSDTPERVAQVNAINAARDAKRAAQRKAFQEAHLQHTLEMHTMFENRAEALAQTAKMHAVIAQRSATAGIQTLFPTADFSNLS